MITRTLRHEDMVALIRRTGIERDRPDLGLLLLSGHSRYREDGVEYMLAGELSATDDGSAWLGVPTAVPAPAPAPVERTRATRAPVDASAEIVALAEKAVAESDAATFKDEDASGDITRDALRRVGL